MLCHLGARYCSRQLCQAAGELGLRLNRSQRRNCSAIDGRRAVRAGGRRPRRGGPQPERPGVDQERRQAHLAPPAQGGVRSTARPALRSSIGSLLGDDRLRIADVQKRGRGRACNALATGKKVDRGVAVFTHPACPPHRRLRGPEAQCKPERKRRILAEQKAEEVERVRGLELAETQTTNMQPALG